MGNQNNTSKDNDLYKMVNKSNPIMMTEKKNRPCKIEGGKMTEEELKNIKEVEMKKEGKLF